MDVVVQENKEKSEVEITISATADEVSPFVREAAKKLSKDRQIKGFRPGKASADVVADAFGEERLLNEALEKAVPQLFVQAVMEEEIEAVDRPKVAIAKAGRTEGLEFTATVLVLPEVTLGDVSAIEVEKRAPQVDEAVVEQELKQLAKTRSSFIDVARPAEEGDTVRVDFKISLNGTVMEGGEAQDHPVTLGEGAFVRDFEDKLVGVSAGDEREFVIRFPEDYGKADLCGKEAQAWVRAKAVQKRVVPEITDDFAKELGKFDSLADLKAKLQENLQAEAAHKEHDRLQATLAAKLAEAATFATIPDVLVEKEIDRQLQEFGQMLTMQQKTLDDYLASRQRTLEQVREEMREQALGNVKTGLAMRAFVAQQAIEVAEEEVQKKMDEYLQRFASAEEAKKNVDVEELREHLTGMVRNQKAMEKLESLVKVKQVESVNDQTPMPNDQSSPKS